MRKLLIYSYLLCQDAIDLLERLLHLFFSTFYSQLLRTTEEAFLGCFAIIALICTLGSMHPCQELNEAAHLSPDAQGQVSVCVCG